ncbi:DUF4258 domain-containing protein [Cytobacillus purgationiresistens]|uniref:DUF4258 domain-containing protein n=1 Tax=Cytobacillus purgationiresistens TaxID=863449 RepID=A0ABU0ASU1_9BACI|nr:DUF4258 domain-containing protein [Cytobacillus purgationiresistens]MDQ0273498.1 hypothetical protein [Cytobacillus purgationiresistens]
MNIKIIKKSLLTNKMRISSHAKEKMFSRGYYKRDIISCIMSGAITSKQFIKNQIRYVIEGVDDDGYPMVVIVGKHSIHQYLLIITIMPPISKKYRRVI